VTGGSNRRVSLAALIAVKEGQRPRLIYRVRQRRRGDKRKGFTETDYARLLDAARRQLGGPVVLVWDNLSAHVSKAMRELIDARDWLTVFRLPPYASELNPVWSHLKRSLANLAKRDLAQLTALAKTRLRRMLAGGQRPVVVDEPDAAVELGVAGEALFDAGHADEDQAEAAAEAPGPDR